MLVPNHSYGSVSSPYLDGEMQITVMQGTFALWETPGDHHIRYSVYIICIA